MVMRISLVLTVAVDCGIMALLVRRVDTRRQPDSVHVHLNVVENQTDVVAAVVFEHEVRAAGGGDGE
jgi:hypothetical protein